MKNRIGLLEDWEANERATRLEKFQYRRWRAGDVYAPHDLSSVAMKHARQRPGPRTDVFDLLGINPMNEYKVRNEGRSSHSSGIDGWNRQTGDDGDSLTGGP